MRSRYKKTPRQSKGTEKEGGRKKKGGGGRGCSWSVLKVNKRIGEREERWAFRNSSLFHPFFTPFSTNFTACSWDKKKKKKKKKVLALTDTHTYTFHPFFQRPYIHTYIHTCTYQIKNPLLTEIITECNKDYMVQGGGKMLGYQL